MFRLALRCCEIRAFDDVDAGVEQLLRELENVDVAILCGSLPRKVLARLKAAGHSVAVKATRTDASASRTDVLVVALGTSDWNLASCGTTAVQLPSSAEAVGQDMFDEYVDEAFDFTSLSQPASALERLEAVPCIVSRGGVSVGMLAFAARVASNSAAPAITATKAVADATQRWVLASANESANVKGIVTMGALLTSNGDAFSDVVWKAASLLRLIGGSLATAKTTSLPLTIASQGPFLAVRSRYAKFARCPTNSSTAPFEHHTVTGVKLTFKHAVGSDTDVVWSLAIANDDDGLTELVSCHCSLLPASDAVTTVQQTRVTRLAARQRLALHWNWRTSSSTPQDGQIDEVVLTSATLVTLSWGVPSLVRTPHSMKSLAPAEVQEGPWLPLMACSSVCAAASILSSGTASAPWKWVIPVT
jgi:hypothetical protein